MYYYTVPATPEAQKYDGWGTALKPANEPICLARKPLSEKAVAANVLRWGTGAINVAECKIGTERIKTRGGSKFPNVYRGFKECQESYHTGRFPANILLDEAAAAMLDEQSGESSGRSGGASRFFYVAKASPAERGAGNKHPTVKPIKLMRYLCKLVTPPNGTVLDPFAGSGTTLLASLMENFNVIGIEKEPEYCEIIRKRIADLRQECDTDFTDK